MGPFLPVGSRPNATRPYVPVGNQRRWAPARIMPTPGVPVHQPEAPADRMARVCAARPSSLAGGGWLFHGTRRAVGVAAAGSTDFHSSAGPSGRRCRKPDRQQNATPYHGAVGLPCWCACRRWPRWSPRRKPPSPAAGRTGRPAVGPSTGPVPAVGPLFCEQRGLLVTKR